MTLPLVERTAGSDEAAGRISVYDVPLQQGVNGANFQSYRVGTATLFVITIDLNVNANLRVVPYYDGNRRAIEQGASSWKAVRGQNALAIVSGTFFNHTGDGKTPFGDVISPSGNFSVSQIPQPTQTKIDQTRRCFLGFVNATNRFQIGWRRPGIQLVHLNAWRYILGGGGWLVYRGQRALEVARAARTTFTPIAGTQLGGQEFFDDVAEPTRRNYRTAVAVNNDGSRIALIVSDKQGRWNDIISFLLGQSQQRLPFVVSEAMMLDGGGTTEMYLRFLKPDRQPTKDERPQPTCLIVLPTPP